MSGTQSGRKHLTGDRLTYRNALHLHISTWLNVGYYDYSFNNDSRLIHVSCMYQWHNRWQLVRPRQANLVLIAYASSEGSGEPAHPRSPAWTSAARSYNQWVKRNLQTESQDHWPLWMAWHGQLKFVMTECSKTQIRLTGTRIVMQV